MNKKNGSFFPFTVYVFGPYRWLVITMGKHTAWTTPYVFGPYRWLVITMGKHTAWTTPSSVFAACRQRLQTTSCLYVVKRSVNLFRLIVIPKQSVIKTCCHTNLYILNRFLWKMWIEKVDFCLQIVDVLLLYWWHDMLEACCSGNKRSK